MTPAETEALVDLARGRTVLELGAQYGHSTRALCSSAYRVVSVDWHRGDAQAGPSNSLLPYLDNVAPDLESGVLIPVVGRFAEVLPLLAPASFNLIFHDGYHELVAMCDDFTRALPLLHWAGSVAVHDWGLFDVTPAAQAVLGPPDRVVGRLAVWTPRRDR